MKVLHVIDKLNIGGAEKVFCDLTNLLNSASIDVSVVVFNKGGEFEKKLDKKIWVLDYERKNKFNFISAFKLAKILKEYDIIHVHMRHVYRYIKIVTLLFGIKNKIILHDHYGSIKVDKSIPKFFKSIFKPKYYIGVSNELTSWAKNKLNIKENSVFLLQNIVLKNKTQLNKKKEGIVIVGNIKPVKNQLFAIKLAKNLNKKLTIIGTIHDKDYYKKLLIEIKNDNLENQINFIHNQNNVQILLPNFEFAILTSRSESGPLVLIEYLAQGLPFLAYKTGEVSNILKNEVPYFFIHNFNIEDWKKRITDNKSKKKNLENLYYKYFSPELYLKKCIDIYHKVESF